MKIFEKKRCFTCEYWFYLDWDKMLGECYYGHKVGNKFPISNENAISTTGNHTCLQWEPNHRYHLIDRIKNFIRKFLSFRY